MKSHPWQSEYGARTGPETIVTGNVPLTASGSFPPIVAAVPVTLSDGTSVAGFEGGAPVAGGPTASNRSTSRSALRSAGHGSIYGNNNSNETAGVTDHLVRIHFVGFTIGSPPIIHPSYL